MVKINYLEEARKLKSGESIGITTDTFIGLCSIAGRIKERRDMAFNTYLTTLASGNPELESLIRDENISIDTPELKQLISDIETINVYFQGNEDDLANTEKAIAILELCNRYEIQRDCICKLCNKISDK